MVDSGEHRLSGLRFAEGCGIVPEDAPALGQQTCPNTDLRTELDGLSGNKFSTVKPSELTLRGFLGRGACAEVFKADWIRAFAGCTSCITVALKRLHSDSEPIYRDREALAILTDHPNIVKCFDSTPDPPYLTINEYCAGGSLCDLIYNPRQDVSFRQSIKILVDVASAMQYLHAQSPPILHRDLKSANVLLTKPIRSTGQTPFAKVADFGLARSASSIHSSMTRGVGTWRWMAPEVFSMSPQKDDHEPYDERADVFSFTMLMYEVLVRKLPYHDTFGVEECDPRIGLHVCMGNRPSLASIPEELRNFMELGWSNSPERRPGFDDILETLSHVLEGAGRFDDPAARGGD